MAARVPLVDTRLLGKPPIFAGREDEDFRLWSFQVKAYLGLVSATMVVGMMAAEDMRDPTRAVERGSAGE